MPIIPNQSILALFANMNVNEKGYSLLKGYLIDFVSGDRNEIFRVNVLYEFISFRSY